MHGTQLSASTITANKKVNNFIGANIETITETVNLATWLQYHP